MTDDDPVLVSFELVAESDRDITADAYEKFYAQCPEAKAIMSHVDPHMQGRMLDEVLQLLMTPGGEVEPGQLCFEMSNHRSYGTSPDHYRPLLEAVRDTVASELADAWNADFAEAWELRIATLLGQIHAQV